MSITVPDTGSVTGEDVTCARMLAEAVGQYVAELERRASAAHEGAEGPGAPAGQAA